MKLTMPNNPFILLDSRKFRKPPFRTQIYYLCAFFFFLKFPTRKWNIVQIPVAKMLEGPTLIKDILESVFRSRALLRENINWL